MAGPASREPLFSWRRICFFLIGLIIFIFLVQAVPRRRTGFADDLHIAHSQARRARFGNASLDNEFIDGLTNAECLAEFPGLYTEINRTVGYWLDKHTVITPEDLQIYPEQAAMRILVVENEMRILQSYHAVDPVQAAPRRALGVLNLFQRALDSATAAGELLPTVEFSVSFQDDPNDKPGAQTHAIWSVARDKSTPAHQSIWLYPNYDFWYYDATGSFDDAKRAAMQHDAPFSTKIPKIAWRGNPDFGPELRSQLLETTKGKEWADVIDVRFKNGDDNAIDIDQFCDYAMTVYTEGVTYSGRMKFLMNCKSLLFAHEIEWVTHYSHLLVREGPNQNYVPVKRDWSDLEEKVLYYLAHPKEADTIIDNSLRTFRSRYTTRAATSCYIRRLIEAYSLVSFDPQVYVPTKDGRGLRRRGFPYQGFFVHHNEDKNWEHPDEN